MMQAVPVMFLLETAKRRWWWRAMTSEYEECGECSVNAFLRSRSMGTATVRSSSPKVVIDDDEDEDDDEDDDEEEEGDGDDEEEGSNRCGLPWLLPQTVLKNEGDDDDEEDGAEGAEEEEEEEEEREEEEGKKMKGESASLLHSLGTMV